MKTQRELYPETTMMCMCELDSCPICRGQMKVAYTSGQKVVQTMQGVLAVAHLPKRCVDRRCTGSLDVW